MSPLASAAAPFLIAKFRRRPVFGIGTVLKIDYLLHGGFAVTDHPSVVWAFDRSATHT